MEDELYYARLPENLDFNLEFHENKKRHILILKRTIKPTCAVCSQHSFNNTNEDKDKLYFCPKTRKFFCRDCLITGKHDKDMMIGEGLHEDYCVIIGKEEE